MSDTLSGLIMSEAGACWLLAVQGAERREGGDRARWAVGGGGANTNRTKRSSGQLSEFFMGLKAF